MAQFRQIAEQVAANFFDTRIDQLRGMTPPKVALLNKELNIFTFGDLMQYFPFRHEDRSKFYDIGELTEDYPFVQVKGRITKVNTTGEGNKKRITALLEDATGAVELVWFKGLNWVVQKLRMGAEYVVFGKPTLFGRHFNIAHPEFEPYNPAKINELVLYPVYSTTELLKKRFLDSKAIATLQKTLLEVALPRITETLPQDIITHYKFIPKQLAIANIHFPKNEAHLHQAKRRLKFEEFFFIQLKLLMQKTFLREKNQGQIFRNVPTITEFYKNHLPFDLTGAQKRVIREIFEDVRSGKQMNRLLQGDVGSGKTIVAFICTLMALDNGAQSCIMVPTEILADQHYTGLKYYAGKLGVTIAKLTGSTKTAERRLLHEQLLNGELKIIVGTHALLEDIVQFQNLGMCIIDEQHRFGVAQRAKLWGKNPKFFPHVLVMTATPIPRTLAMTVYGDLDVSVIDELPAGRKPIKTIHKFDSNRLHVFGFIQEQIDRGRQVYVVYPLIEESEAMDYKNLMDGYESVSRAFPGVPVSIVHGKMKPQDKDYEMQRFIKGETKIMVATTVIEVGVNVPNASVMVIENAEKFGLAQLHQLRGRVGRGAEQSYCVLMTDFKLSRDAKVRIETMVKTNNGFEIADIDMKLRGPGDLVGTQQSGVLDLRIADIAKDQVILQEARACALDILQKDPHLEMPEHEMLRRQVNMVNKQTLTWSLIS